MDKSISNVGVRCEGMIGMDLFQRFMDDLLATDEDAMDFLRVKAVLNVAGSDKKFVLQAIHMLRHGGFVDAEWAEGEARESKIIFIGRGMQPRRKALTDAFAPEWKRTSFVPGISESARVATSGRPADDPVRRRGVAATRPRRRGVAPPRRGAVSACLRHPDRRSRRACDRSADYPRRGRGDAATSPPLASPRSVGTPDGRSERRP